jgi:hypothetical protein
MEDFATEIQNWSDGTLRILVEEENCSPVVRQIIQAELASRPESLLTLSGEMIHGAATQSNGWNRKQLSVLGVPWPPPSGWLKKLEGRKVMFWQWQKFLSLRTVKKV